MPRGSNNHPRAAKKDIKTKGATGTLPTPKEVVYPASCIFCEADDDDEEVYGQKVRKCGMTVHYFCMLFSSGLLQRGKTDKDGIYGFLPDDIGKEKTRGLRLKCTFCRKNGATIGCVVKNCRKVFHFGCGQKAGALNQYFDSYRSFCTSHRPRQTCPVSDRLSFYGTANSMCVICMSAVEARASNETLRAPCCKNTWFHRKCIQRQALAAGLYFFKCPLCCNKEIFQAEMLQVGIYIPEQDAAWEMEPHAYQELLEPYSHCDMESCRCPRGRKYARDESTWEIVVCHWCGSQGSHIGCVNSKKPPTPSSSSSAAARWSCQACALIDTELRKERKKKTVCSPVKQDPAVLPPGKSPRQSPHIGRKLPVKQLNTLQSPLNDGLSSTSGTPVCDESGSVGSLSPRSRASRKRRRNTWQRGHINKSAKKRKVTSATITQVEASLATPQGDGGQGPSQQVNAENVNPVNTEERRSLRSSSGSEAACSSRITEPLHKERKKCSTSLIKILKDPEVLSDIKNNKLCDSSPTSQSTPRLRRQSLASNAPYVLRNRKNSDTSLSPLPFYPDCRTLRSGKTVKDIDIPSSWKQTLGESSFKSTPPQKKHKLQDGNNNSELCLSSDINGTCFNPVNDSEPSLFPHPCSSSPSSFSAVEISRESSCVSPTFAKCLTKNVIYRDKENSKAIEKMIDCDCMSCCNFVIFSSDNESEAGDENSASLVMSVTHPEDNNSLTMMSVSMIEEEAGNGQKCDDPNCDCTSPSSSPVYPMQLLSVTNSPFTSTTNTGAYGIDDSYHLAAMKHFIESAPGSVPSSPSSRSSSVITLSSSSDYESCKSSSELNTNPCPFEVQTLSSSSDYESCKSSNELNTNPCPFEVQTII